MPENEVATFNPMQLMPATFGDKYKMAQLLSKSGLIPQSLNTPEKVCVALQWGHELQLSPMVAVNNITVVNGKPTLSADVMSAVVKRSPEYGGIEWIKQTDDEAECIVIRRGKGYEEKTRSRYTMQDAQKAGLTGKDVWKKYPRRMLKHRCLSYALRDAFPDILAGLYNPEEMESVTDTDYATPQERDITPQATVQYTEPPADEAPVDFEAMRSAMPEAEPVQPQESEYDRLCTLVQRYGEELKKSSQTPTPYQRACDVIGNPDEGRCADMYIRCVAWLGKKGIKAA